MQKNNAALLGLVAVATLLVAVVGVTFAYFTASTANSGAGENATITTTTIGDVTLTMGAGTTTNVLEYPGGYMVVGASVTGTHTGTTPYNTTYTVNGNISNGTTTQLTWTLYEVASSVATPVSGCTVKETTAVGSTQYTYTGCTVSTAITNGTKVKQGTVAASGSADVIATGETLTTTTAGAKTYYYLVVHYPETNQPQNADQGKSITASLTNISNGVASTK